MPTSKDDKIFNSKPEVREKGTVLLNYFKQRDRVGTEQSETNNSSSLSNYDDLILL